MDPVRSKVILNVLTMDKKELICLWRYFSSLHICCVLNIVPWYLIPSIFSVLNVKHPTLTHTNADKSYHRTWGSRLARGSIQALLALREDKTGDLPSFLELVFHYGLLSLTAGPGMPLSPCGPDFPGCPWGPTGPVFPMRPSKPGLPWKQTALGDHLKLWLFGVSYFCFSPLLLSTLLFLPCLVFPSDPEGQNFKNLSVWICHTGAAMLTCKKKT